MVSPSTSDYQGSYEWATAEDATGCAEALLPLLRLLSDTGTVTSDLVPGRSLATYLATRPGSHAA